MEDFSMLPQKTIVTIKMAVLAILQNPSLSHLILLAGRMS